MSEPVPDARGTRPDDEVLAELAEVFGGRPEPDVDTDDTDDTPPAATPPPVAPPSVDEADTDDADTGDAPTDDADTGDAVIGDAAVDDAAIDDGDTDTDEATVAGAEPGAPATVDDEPPRRSGGTDPLLRPRRPATPATGTGRTDVAASDETDVDTGPDVEPGDAATTAAGASGDPDTSRQTIAIDADDDLPDAVYLDDELAGTDSSSGTVFIDDDDVADAVAAKDATGSSIEPRFRQRLIGVRRAEGLRRLRLVAAVVAVVLVVGGGLAVLGSPLFDIDDVSVDGAVYTDPVALQEVVDDLQGTPVLLADTGDAEDRLEDIPWVENARVSTRFPSSARIELRERMPLVTMRGTDGLFRVLDGEGRVLDSIEGQPVAMVLITGPGTLDIAPGEFAPIGYSAAASLVTKFTPDIRVRVQSMLVTPDGSDLRLVLTNGDAPPIEVEFGSALGDNDQIEKLVRLQRALDDIGTDPVSVINVSTAEVTVV